MTGPEEPGDDWGFPEVDPASIQLPPDEDEEPVYDTGSDAWWRAQAEAQRRAAAAEPAVPPADPPVPPVPPVVPPELVEPTVLTTASPLDEGWLPPELPELHPTEEPPEEDEPVEEEAPDEAPSDDVAVTETADQGPDWYRGLVDRPADEPMPAEVPPEPDEDAQPPAVREPYEPQRVGPARALAGAALALLGVLLAIGALVLFHGNDEPTGGPVVSAGPTTVQSAAPTSTGEPSPTPPATTAPAVAGTTPSATAAPTQAPVVPVTVLNNSRRTGFAKQAAAEFRAGGWPVPTTGNYRGRIQTTTVYYAPGQEASARRFAAQFHIPRVLPRSDLPGIPSQGMTVVLTRDYQL